MRESLTADAVRSFMSGLADAARAPGRVYLVGGASAVLLGWRNATIDLDLKLIPETDDCTVFSIAAPRLIFKSGR